jgi:uncharacterized protein (DUF1697 family)
VPRYVAYLRAINVGGRVVKMHVLRRVFENLGFRSVETFIASGNVIFDSTSKARASLENRIEKALEDSLGYEVATFLRTVEETGAIAEHRAFPAAAIEKSRAFCVGLMKDAAGKAEVQAIHGLRTEVDDFHVNGAEVYWLCAQKQSESKFSNALFERTVRRKATFRGITTMERLFAKHGATQNAPRER